MSTTKLILSVSSLIMALLFLFFVNLPSSNLQIISCDVGQGDATLIIHRKTQILIDGGLGKRVLECLDSNIPFWDREIELVILTHPQKDHFEGLIYVLQAYQVQSFLKTNIDTSTQEYQVLENDLKLSGTQIINAQKVKTLGSGMIRLDILHPSETYLASVLGASATKEGSIDSVQYKSFDPNQASVVVRLKLGEFDALFTGDVGPKESDIVAELLAKSNPDIEYIKVPHHGSKNGLSEKLLKTANPKVATISTGKNNSYGHPHKEILDMLDRHGVVVLRTDLDGEVKVVTDGYKIWIER